MRTELLIADHFDTLSSGKIVALGLFPDLVMVIKPHPTAPPPTAEMPHGLDLDMMVTLLKPPPAGVVGQLTVTPPGQDDPVLELALPAVALPKGRTANVHIRMRPLLVPRYGKFKVRLRYGTATTEHTFEVRQEAPAAPAEAIRTRARKTAPKDATKH